MTGRNAPLSRLGWHLLLALLMLLMQQGALRHSLQHAANEDTAPAHSTLCKDCLSFQAFDAVAPSLPVVTLASNRYVHSQAQRQPQRHALVESGYLSRAPPSLSPWF